MASSAPNEEQSELLLARERFLNCEKDAAQHAHQDANYWQHIYDGMDSIIKQFTTVETDSSENNKPEAVKENSKEKVFYIETQGKKIDNREVAEAASRLEIELVKDPIGKQDQYAAAFGGFLFYRHHHPIPMEPVKVEQKHSQCPHSECVAAHGATLEWPVEYAPPVLAGLLLLYCAVVGIGSFVVQME